MNKKEKLAKWNEYFKVRQKKGLSWNDIRIELISKYHYSARNVELLIFKYKQDKERQVVKIKNVQLIGALILLLILITSPFFIQKPGITGHVIGEGNIIVYVNQSNPDCDDKYTREEASDITTPWCLPSSTNTAKMLSGDTMYIIAGSNNIYRTGLKVSNKVLTEKTIITAYPGDNIIITRGLEQFYDKTSNPWAITSTPGAAMWVANVNSSENCVYGWYNDTDKNLYAACDSFTICTNSDCTGDPQMTFSWFNSTDLMLNALWYDRANHKLYLKLTDTNLNPNEMSFWIGAGHSLEISNVNGAELEISNLTIHGFNQGAWTDASRNITFRGNIVHSNYRGFDCSGESSYINYINNTIYAKRADQWTWKQQHSSPQENQALQFYHCNDGIKILNNTIFGLYNGVEPTYLSSYGLPSHELYGMEVAYNHIYEIFDDAIEPEDYANCYNIHNNNIHDVHVVLTLTPSNSSYCPSNFSYNIAIANLSDSLEGDSTMRTFKLSGSKAQNQTSGWNIFHNTLSGNDAIIQSAVLPDMMQYFNWTDNIFYQDNAENRLIDRSGIPADHVFYDYNLYYKPSGYAFKYWSSDTNNAEYHNLTDAKAGGNWNGIWDAHSNFQNPNFSSGFAPAADSIACHMSSTGSYVGAVPCEGESNPSELVCGDEVCNGDENCSTCESDCGACLSVNNPPTQSTPILNASDNPINSTNATLMCYNQSTSDADGDVITNSYRWFRNSSLISGLTENSVSESETSVGDRWTCEVKPYDGTDDGIAMNSSALIIQAVCGDAICNGAENCASCNSDCGICNITGCTLSNKSWNEDTALTDAYNLSSCFNDPLNSTLYYSATGNNSINISIDQNGEVNLSQAQNWNGQEHIVFTATDGSRSTFTNNLTLTVNPIADCGDGICESGENCTTCNSDCGACPIIRSGGGNGGASTTTNKDWNCGEWSKCIGNEQSQICTNINNDIQKINTKNCTTNSKSTKGSSSGTIKNEANNTATVIVPKKENLVEQADQITNIKNQPEQQVPGNIQYASAPDTINTIIYGMIGVIVIILMVIVIYINWRNKKRDKEIDFEVHTEKKSHYRVMEAIRSTYEHIKNVLGRKASSTKLVLSYKSKENSLDENHFQTNKPNLSDKNLQKTKDLRTSIIPESDKYLLPQLNTFVRQAAERGYTKGRVNDELLAAGWTEELIQNLISIHEQEFLSGGVAECEPNQFQAIWSDSSEFDTQRMNNISNELNERGKQI